MLPKSYSKHTPKTKPRTISKLPNSCNCQLTPWLIVLYNFVCSAFLLEQDRINLNDLFCITTKLGNLLFVANFAGQKIITPEIGFTFMSRISARQHVTDNH